MNEFQSVGAVRRGYVRGVVSSRLGGVAFPVDLVRVAASIARRDGARRRVASAFAGYLVTDAGPDVVPMFAKHRVWHEQGPDLYCMTSERMGWGYRSGGVVDSGPIDAPEMVACGSMLCGSGFDGVQSAARRWLESRRGVGLPLSVEEDGAGTDAGKVRRDSAGRVVLLLATGPRCHGLRGGVVVAAEVGALDAPEFLPGGSVQREDDLAGFVACQRLVLRGGWSL